MAQSIESFVNMGFSVMNKDVSILEAQWCANIHKLLIVRCLNKNDSNQEFISFPD